MPRPAFWRISALGMSAGVAAALAGASAVAPQGSSAAVTTGLVAAYSFDEGSGTTVSDGSGSGNTGTIRGAAWTTAGRFGSALSFDGRDDWVTVADSDSLDLAGAMTVEAWVNPRGLGNWRTAVIKEQTAELVYALYADSPTNQPAGIVFIGAELDVRGGSKLAQDVWTHLATTYDGAALRLYVNGALASSRLVSGSMPASAGSLRIGGNSVWGEWFEGRIDEVRIYNRALSAEEIRTDMDTALGGGGAAEPPPSPPSGTGLVAAYPLDEGAGTVITDLSGSGNTGTIREAAWTTGRFGGALSFDGVNDWVTIVDAPSLDLSTGMTLEAWVNPAAATPTATAVLKEQASNVVYGLKASLEKKEVDAHVFTSRHAVARTGAQLPVGSWTHLAATYDGSALRLFVNGSEVTSKGVAGSIVNSTGPLRIGGNAVWGEWFRGRIDEVRLYARALTASEIQSDMNRPVDATPPSIPTALTTSGTGETTIALTWTASADDLAVAGYGLYRNDASVGSATGTSATFTGLACGAAYTLAVDAFDGAGNRSAKASTVASTAACTPPEPPTALMQTGAAETSISLGWTASPSADVAGYGVYRDGVLVTTAPGTSTTLGGLACGTEYTLAVDAVDHAANRSLTAPSVVASTSPCPPPGTAAVFVSPTGSDANPCTQAAPCLTFNRAYQAALPGQTVEAAGGTYGAQTIGVDATKTSPDDVLFRPAPGAVVTVSGEVNVDGRHLEFRDMAFEGGWVTRLGADDVTFRNIRAKHLFITSASNVSVLGGSVGPGVNYDSQVTTAPGSSTPPTNILIDGVYFHDWTRTGDQHVECLQFGSGVNVTIRNSGFENCATHDVFIRSWGTLNAAYHPLKNFVVENNFLDVTLQGFYTIQFVDDLAPDATSFVARYNSSLQPFYDGVTKGPISFTGNILSEMTSFACSSSGASRWRYNVYETGVPCGVGDRVGTVLYRDRATLDLHLLAGSAAVDAGDPASFPAADIDGQARFAGAAPDAGADEAGQ